MSFIFTSALLVGVLSIWVVVRELYNRWEVKYLAKKHGCESPFHVSGFPLGIPLFWTFYRLTKSNTIVEYVHNKFDKDPGRDTFYTEIAGIERIFTRDPENIKALLSVNVKDYDLGRRHAAMSPLLGNGIFTSDDEVWKHSRAMLRPQFSRQQVSQLNSLHNHVDNLFDNFKTAPTNDGFFDVQELFHRLTLDSASEFLLGESVHSLKNSNRAVQGPNMEVTAIQFADSINYCQAMVILRFRLGKLYWLVYPKKLREGIKLCQNFVDYFVYRALEQTKIEKNYDKEFSKNDNNGLSYIFINELAKQTRDPIFIRDQALNVLIAGKDTTASLLSFIICEIGKDKRVWNKLREAILETFGTDGTNLSFESLKRCIYLGHTINEVLRLYPVVPFNGRSAITDTKFPRGGGADENSPVFVKKGTSIFYDVHSMHRNKKYWGEDVNEFRPERWEEPKLHTWDYLPFNGGPRTCLGQQSALIETSLTIARILQTYKDIELSPRILKPTKINLGLSAKVAEGVWVKFVEA